MNQSQYQLLTGRYSTLADLTRRPAKREKANGSPGRPPIEQANIPERKKSENEANEEAVKSLQDSLPRLLGSSFPGGPESESAIAGILSQLPEGEREHCEMMVLQGLSRPKIAELTGWSYATIYKSTSSGMARLTDLDRERVMRYLNLMRESKK